ncbi:response regulator [Nakamurella deserti]|uniref:response regulator n=1 Tax=Nakamurella deserti TaxID=2164074 RepID=UPI000DBE6357|nr:response regulator transcription factor [Nakamurella deserti]
MSDPLRVVIVDDHELVRAGFRIILDAEDDIDVVGQAADGAAGVTVVGELTPDVVLMDVQMPGMDGIEATRQILAGKAVASGARCGPAVIILTTFDRDDYLFAALRAGASGFLLKNSSPEDLIEAIHVVGRGDALLAPEITRRVIERFVAAPAAQPSMRPGAAAQLAELTEREHEVLVRLAGGASNAEIAGQLFLGEATVKTHVSRVLMKLGLRDRTQAVVFAYENGVVRPRV